VVEVDRLKCQRIRHIRRYSNSESLRSEKISDIKDILRNNPIPRVKLFGKRLSCRGHALPMDESIESPEGYKIAPGCCPASIAVPNSEEQPIFLKERKMSNPEISVRELTRRDSNWSCTEFVLL